MKLETLGEILTGGFGDKVLVGIAIGLIKKATPEDCYELIRDNRSLFEEVSDEGWANYREMTKDIRVEITRESIISQLRKHRVDLLGVILNYPSGTDWLDRQIAELKGRLGRT